MLVYRKIPFVSGKFKIYYINRNPEATRANYYN